ncbi:MAG: hypothetical protein GY822_05090 [Deltaproteobacteria bacterium]|nr:hypothetical protein [Deltaproteobacteria bacterium]
MMIVYSGTEGGSTMSQNLAGAAPSLGIGDLIFGVLDGVDYRNNPELEPLFSTSYVRNITSTTTTLFSFQNPRAPLRGCGLGSKIADRISPPIGPTTSSRPTL